MAYLDFVTRLHTSTKRNYVQRVVEFDKAECATKAIQYGKDYWDGERQYGYGGYKYDGRWRPVAEAICKHYGIKAGDSILDVGCGKGFLLYEMTQVVPGIKVTGIDISEYGIQNSKPEIKQFLQIGNATKLPFADKSFDLVISLTTFHNLMNFELYDALKEVERVGKKNKYIMIESYRTEAEKANLLYWQLTCRTFYKPEEWEWFFKLTGYTGDYGAIYFE